MYTNKNPHSICINGVFCCFRAIRNSIIRTVTHLITKCRIIGLLSWEFDFLQQQKKLSRVENRTRSF